MLQIDEIVAISFDADGTLWNFQHTMRNALAHCLAELRRLVPGSGAEALTVESLIAIRDAVASDLRNGGATHEQIRHAAFARTLAMLGVEEVAQADAITTLYFAYRHGESASDLYPDARPALDVLKGRYHLGLASNGNTDPVHGGLGGYFTFALYADELGAVKPDPQFYRRLLATAQLEPQQLLHIGDSLTHDVAAAQSVGVQSVWLNRLGESHAHPIYPDAEITTLAELPALLGL